MPTINLGGTMPDGAKARDFWVEEDQFICASGTALQGSLFKMILGKLCLIRSALIMLPYEGLMVKAAELLAGKLRSYILGDFADMADAMEKLGLIHNGYEILSEVLVWPLEQLEGDARVEPRRFLGLGSGADLMVPANGQQYAFNLKGRGHEVAGFASAEEFCEYINRLR